MHKYSLAGPKPPLDLSDGGFEGSDYAITLHVAPISTRNHGFSKVSSFNTVPSSSIVLDVPSLKFSPGTGGGGGS